ncbi:hypothetical protein AB0I27_22760 [Streptomyces sp. NPDC050597]|uniref:hypothetical protein n=1 Tax=Streptomyces sp. NPDC050597 TaxID=3157212 RepID=UPI003437EBD4
MGPAIVAVTGTLLGSLLTFLVGDMRARRDRRRQDLAAAIKAVLEGAVRLRNRQYLKHAARRNDEADGPEAREARYDARTNLTSALDTLYLATGDRQLLAAAQEAFDTAVALGDAEGDQQIEAAGLRARQAHTALRTAGADTLHG